MESDDSSYEIIWANDTSLFDHYGKLKYIQGKNFTIDEKGIQRMTPEEEQMVILGDGPYEFTYQSDFLGFPMTDSDFKVIASAYKALGNPQWLASTPLNFINQN